MTATDKPARRTVSAEEKAREALGVADRKVARLSGKVADLEHERLEVESDAAAEVKRITSEIDSITPLLLAAQERRGFLASDPALKADATAVAKYEAGE